MIESNTLFLLSIASYGVGIVISEYGLRMGVAFFIASVTLSFFLVPVKMYSLTLAAMELYLLIKYTVQAKIGRSYVVVKYLIFNILFVPALIFFPSLIYRGKVDWIIVVLIWGGGQIVFTIYEIAYNWALGKWNQYRNKAKS